MDPQILLNSISTNNLSHSNYLLFGEEHFFIDQIESCFVENTIAEDLIDFNRKIFYGKDTDVFSLISVLQSFPMSGLKQLVVLREAHKMDGIHELEFYFKNPVESTVFVLCYKNKTIDKRKKWVKEFQKKGLVFESKKIYGQKISNWLNQVLSNANMKIEKSAEILLIDSLGSDLSKLFNALKKLISIVNDGKITASSVQEHIGFHREYNNFELQNALAEKNAHKVFLITNYFESNPNKFPLPLTLGLLFSFFSKLLLLHSFENSSQKYIAEKIKVHPFFVSSYQTACKHYSFEACVQIITYLKDCDLKFKGLKGVDKNPLKELMLKIISS